MQSRQYLGALGEEAACRLLQSKGYVILHRNYRSRFGEIDLIAQTRDYLCFVEVKARQSVQFGEPREAVTRAKQSKLTRLAIDYIAHNPCGEWVCRFDIVEVLLDETGVGSVLHLENAFDPDSHIWG